jgi:hypothetical protein
MIVLRSAATSSGEFAERRDCVGVLRAEGGAIGLAHTVDLVEEQARRHNLRADLAQHVGGSPRAAIRTSDRTSDASTTNSSSDASSASASVDRNDATRSYASFLMNPTVSETSMRGFVSGFSARTVVSSVAKSLSATSTSKRRPERVQQRA